MDETPLWATEDQEARLAELTATTSDPAKELPLRRDVRSLGILLGRVLVEQSGQNLLDVVEHLRRLLIHNREVASPGNPKREDSSGNEDGMAQARANIARLPVEDAYKLTKAFSIYFELTNLAETNHRKRRRRAARLHTDQAPLPGSFRGTLSRLENALGREHLNVVAFSGGKYVFTNLPVPGATLPQQVSEIGGTKISPVGAAVNAPLLSQLGPKTQHSIQLDTHNRSWGKRKSSTKPGMIEGTRFEWNG